MSFTITRKLEQLPSYPKLCELADRNQIRLAGDEHVGSFSGQGVTGDYEFSGAGIHGTFTGHGVTGAFSFADGKVIVTITGKPFWLPEAILRHKITEGLDALGGELG